MKRERNKIKLSDIEKKTTFSIPDNYFHKLNSDIISRIEKTILINNKKLKVSPLKTPEKYFNELPEKIEKKIFIKKTLLHDTLKDTIFSTPENYFIQLHSEIKEKTTENNSPDSIPLWDIKPLIKYAVAASTASLLILSTYWLYQNVNNKDSYTSSAYPKVTELEVNTLITEINKEDIREYLSYHDELLMDAALISKKNIYKEITKDIPLDNLDKEIIKEELELLDSDELEQELDLEL